MYHSLYAVPNMCARCAVTNPTETHEIKSTPFLLNLTSFFGTKSFVFKVPICSRCKQELINIKLTAIIITVISVIIGGAIGSSSTYADGSMTLGAFFGLILGAVIGEIIKYMLEANIGSYTGHRYKFRNEEFMKAFNQLNPHLS